VKDGHSSCGFGTVVGSGSGEWIRGHINNLAVQFLAGAIHCVATAFRAPPMTGPRPGDEKRVLRLGHDALRENAQDNHRQDDNANWRESQAQNRRQEEEPTHDKA
jgi:hypothetical protein